MEATSTHKIVLIKIVKPHKHVESLVDMFWTGVRIPSGPLLGFGIRPSTEMILVSIVSCSMSRGIVCKQNKRCPCFYAVI